MIRHSKILSVVNCLYEEKVNLLPGGISALQCLETLRNYQKVTFLKVTFPSSTVRSRFNATFNN
jgi:hypothetical protein